MSKRQSQPPRRRAPQSSEDAVRDFELAALRLMRGCECAAEHVARVDRVVAMIDQWQIIYGELKPPLPISLDRIKAELRAYETLHSVRPTKRGG